jgi:hypothetical protein
MGTDAASRARLLYVTDVTDDDVYIPSLPTGKLAGKLTGFNQPIGDCVDNSGDVFITEAQSGDIREFRHGAKQAFNVLADSGYYPLGCSFDPTTGNLAVTNEIASNGGGNVAVYKRTKGTATFYSDSNIYQYGWCAYDDKGNLYVDGSSDPPSDNPEFAELPTGKQKFTTITLNGDLDGYNWLQWDGKYIAVSSGTAEIDEFAISGSSGTEVGSTPLSGERYVLGFWLESSNGKLTLYAPVLNQESRRATKTFYAVENPWAATVSIKAN